MKAFCTTLVVSALAAVAVPCSANVIVFSTVLTGLGEAVPTSTATGNATVSFNDVTNTVAVSVMFAGLANSSAFGHIHCCTAATNAGNSAVALGFNALPAATSGSYSDTFSLTAANFATLLAGTSNSRAYVNIHTPGTYAGGEIRGFLTLQPAAVPVPASLVLVMSGLFSVGLIRRKITPTAV